MPPSAAMAPPLAPCSGIPRTAPLLSRPTLLTYSRYVCVCVEFIIRCRENVILECFVRATDAEERGRRVDDVNTDCKRIHRRVNLQSSVTSSTTQTPARAMVALHRATCCLFSPARYTSAYYFRHVRIISALLLFSFHARCRGK